MWFWLHDWHLVTRTCSEDMLEFIRIIFFFLATKIFLQLTTSACIGRNIDQLSMCHYKFVERCVSEWYEGGEGGRWDGRTCCLWLSSMHHTPACTACVEKLTKKTPIIRLFVTNYASYSQLQQWILSGINRKLYYSMNEWMNEWLSVVDSRDGELEFLGRVGVDAGRTQVDGDCRARNGRRRSVAGRWRTLTGRISVLRRRRGRQRSGAVADELVTSDVQRKP